MFKRVRWLTFGALLGLGGSRWAKRKAKRVLGWRSRHALVLSGSRARSLPGGSLAAGARAVVAEGADILADGREAMREREAELHSRLGPRVQPSLRSLLSGPTNCNAAARAPARVAPPRWRLAELSQGDST